MDVFEPPLKSTRSIIITAKLKSRNSICEVFSTSSFVSSKFFARGGGTTTARQLAKRRRRRHTGCAMAKVGGEAICESLAERTRIRASCRGQPHPLTVDTTYSPSMHMHMRFPTARAKLAHVLHALHVGPNGGPLSRELVCRGCRRFKPILALVKSHEIGFCEFTHFLHPTSLPQIRTSWIFNGKEPLCFHQSRDKGAHVHGLRVALPLA